MNTRSLIRLWGIADLACALTLLNIIDLSIFNNIQTEMFVDPQDLLTVRAFGCFVLLNSMIRMSYHRYHNSSKLVSFSYFLEFYLTFTEGVFFKTLKESNIWCCSLVICLVMATNTYNL